MHQWSSSLGMPADQLPCLWCNSLRESGNEREGAFLSVREGMLSSLRTENTACRNACFCLSFFFSRTFFGPLLLWLLRAVFLFLFLVHQSAKGKLGGWYCPHMVCRLWVGKKPRESLSVAPIMRKKLRMTPIGSQVWEIVSKLVLSRNPRWLVLILFLELVKTSHIPPFYYYFLKLLWRVKLSRWTNEFSAPANLHDTWDRTARILRRGKQNVLKHLPCFHQTCDLRYYPNLFTYIFTFMERML